MRRAAWATGGIAGLFLAVCMAVAIPARGAAEANSGDWVGTWQLKIAADDGEHQATLVLSKDGDSLKGEYNGETGKHAAKDLALKDGELRFRIESKLNDEALTLNYKVSLKGDMLKGDVEYKLGENSGSLPFEGKRDGKSKEGTRPSSKATATPAARIKTPKGFKAELLYSVPQETQGSWVNMTVDPKGRLIVSDQYGKLYRVTVPALGGKVEEIRIEPIDAEIGEAHGLLWAADSLYVVVNRGRKYDSGLYRVRDTNGDDRLDKVELLRKIDGGGEHGPHAVVLSPDGKWLYIVAGNATQVPKLEGSLVPKLWGEDNLLPYMVDGSGFMTGERAPGGYVVRTNLDGTHWELVANGFRNEFDLAFNHNGDLFTYDSDMEWDVNTPWYRPTRVLHVVSGGEYGYRNGSGKWPPYYIDSLPAAANVGPGSPTGVTFGYGAKFPAKYQDALYLCDWSYGKLYALHLKPQGATYTGELEEFVAGTPLALTDVVVNPKDGAMYFAVGGRNTQSGLYRVTYAGDESTSPSPAPASVSGLVDVSTALRHKLEAFHGHKDPKAVETAWPFLGNADRFIRWAARVAIEFQDPSEWRDRALAETSSVEATLNALLALTRVSAQDPAHRVEGAPAPDAGLRDKILAALDRIGWDGLSHAQRLDLLRVYQVVLNRFGRPDDATVSRLIGRFNPHYPAPSRELSIELSQLLVYLQAPDAAAKTVALLEKAPTQEEQMDYARVLRLLKQGWTPQLRETYFSWFLKAAKYNGGNSFGGFMANIKRDALANLSDAEKAALKPILEAKPASTDTAAAVVQRPFVKTWTLDELVPAVEANLNGRDYDRGRTLFAAAKCFACHRFNNEGGGLGPDLSGVAGRFGVRDLLESIVVPSKTISDQYEAVTIATDDGRVVTGRIVNLHGDTLMISPDMLAPNNMVNIARSHIEEMKASPVSLMPEGLLNTLNRDEVLDLMAYLLSRGDRENSMFRRVGSTSSPNQRRPTPNDTLKSPEVSPDHKVTFRIYAPKASQVSVSGDWISQGLGTGGSLRKDDQGVWSITVGPLVPDVFSYSFVVDGVRTLDPKNPMVKPGVSSVDNMFEVPGEEATFEANRDVPHGEVRVAWYYSHTLNMMRSMHVYTPAGYEVGDTKYPVFYLLHGGGDDDSGWTTIGRAGFILDNLLAAKKAKPMIVVMPNGSLPRPANFPRFTPGTPPSPEFLAAMEAAQERFTNELLKEVVPLVESRYRVQTGRENRAIAGLSMGGGQTLRAVMSHPDQFAYVGVWSAAIFRNAGDFEKRNAAFLDHSDKINELIKLFSISVGEKDSLLAGSKNLATLLNSRGIKHELHVGSGGHTWINWRHYLNDFAPLLFR